VPELPLDPKKGPIGMASREAAAGAAVYQPWVLRGYDRFVHGFSNAFAWSCPTNALQVLYDEHCSELHLDVGVGSGFFLDRCRFPSAQPKITLVDLNPNALRFTARRIERYRPTLHEANVLAPLQLQGGPFRSVALMYLLHCLPAPFGRKEAVFQHVGEHLAAEGVLFGATILGRGVPTTPLGRLLQRLYNARGIFGNAQDGREDLEHALSRRFTSWEVRLRGSVALFVARGYRTSGRRAG
jgi:hypothetical protein